MIEIRRATEVVGLVALVLSLAFLTYEQKRANDIAEGEAIANIMGEINNIVEMLAYDETLDRIWSQGQNDAESLNDDELRRFLTIFNYIMNTYEMATMYVENSLVDEQFAEYLARDLCGVIESNEGTRIIWASMKEDRAAVLVSFVNTHCPQVSSK